MITHEELLTHSYNNGLSHIASALSMLTYLNELFFNQIVTPNDKIILGKPFGSQAYYLIWKKLGYLNEIKGLNVGVKHDEIDFVDYSEETMGNALGVAIGISLMNPTKRIWVNITDATLQMGNTLEALQFIGHNKLTNIFVTVDFNDAQVTGVTSNILDVKPIVDLCRNYNWHVQSVDGHNKNELRKSFSGISNYKPNIVFCLTKKGYGIKSIEENSQKWHYRSIQSEEELKLLLSENEKDFT